MADGSIRIDLKIETDKAKQELKNAVSNTKELERQFLETERVIAKATGKVEELTQKLKDVDINTPQADSLTLKLQNAKDEIFYARQAQEELKGQIDESKQKELEFAGQIKKANEEQENLNVKSKGISTEIGNGIKKIARYAVALLSIRSIYGMLSNVANAWLNSNDAGARQLKSDIEYMKYALGSTLSPIIQFVVGLLQQAVSAVATIVQFFTGTDVLAESYAGYMENANSSASATTKELQKQLASFDKINKLESNQNTGGSGGGGSSSRNPLPTKLGYNEALQEELNKIKDTWDYYYDYFDVQNKEGLDKVGATIMAGLATIGETVIRWIDEWTGVNLHDVFAGVKGVLKAVFGDIGNMTYQELWRVLKYCADMIVDNPLFPQSVRDATKQALDKASDLITSNETKIQLQRAIEEGTVDSLRNAEGLIEIQSKTTGRKIAYDLENGIYYEISSDGTKNQLGSAVSNTVQQATQNSQNNVEKSGQNSATKWASGFNKGQLGQRSNIANTTSSVVNSAASNVNPSNFFSVGANVILGILRGITGNSGNLFSVMTSVASTLLRTFKNALGIHSPSREMMDLAKFIPLGIAEGIDATSDKAVDSMRSLANDLTDVAEDIEMPKVGINAVNYIPRQSISTNAIQSAIVGNAVTDSNYNGINNSRTNITLELDGEVLLQKMIGQNNGLNFATNGGGL